MQAIIKDYRQYFKTINSNVRRYYLIVLVSAIAASAFNVLLGIYLKQVGYGENVVGSLLSLMTVGSAIGAIPVSVLASRINKRNTIVLGLGTMLLMGLGLINLNNLLSMQICAFFYGIGQASVMILQGPILYDNTESHHRITAFSIAFVLQNLAAVIANFSVGHLSTFLSDALGPIGANALVLNAATAMLLISMWLSWHFTGSGMTASYRSGTLKSAFGETLSDFRSVLKGGATYYILQVCFIGFGAGLVVPFFSMYLKFMLGITDSSVGTIMAFSQMGTILGGLCVAPLAKHFGRARTVIACQLLSIPFLISISLPQGIVIVAISFFFRSTLMNMASPIIGSLAMEIVDEEVRTHMSSMVSMTNNLFRALGIFVGGQLMTISYNFPYYITIICYLIGTTLFYKSFAHVDQ